MGNDLKLRRWQESDGRLIYDWRIAPQNLRWFVDQSELIYSDHEHWYANFMADSQRYGLVLESDSEAVAQIRFDPAEMPGCYRVSLSTANDKSAHGYGSRILHLACNDEDVRKHAALLVAETMHDNLPSQKMFSRNGFIQAGCGESRGFKLLCWLMPLSVITQPLMMQFFAEPAWLEDIDKLLSMTGLALPGDASTKVKVFLGAAASSDNFDSSMLFHINFCESAILDLALHFPVELKLPVEFYNTQTAVAQIAASLNYLQNCR